MCDREIWLSKVAYDTQNVRGTDIDRSEPGWKSLLESRTVPKESLPLRLYSKFKDETFKTLPPVIQGGGGLKFSAELERVFSRFNLGKAFLIPARLYLYDRVSEIDKDLFVYVGDERKELAFIPEESKGLRIPPGYPAAAIPYWIMSSDLKDGDVAVSKKALEGADIWVDSKLQCSLFMTGAVVNALREVGLADCFNFVKCRIIKIS